LKTEIDSLRQEIKQLSTQLTLEKEQTRKYINMLKVLEEELKKQRQEEEKKK